VGVLQIYIVWYDIEFISQYITPLRIHFFLSEGNSSCSVPSWGDSESLLYSSVITRRNRLNCVGKKGGG